MLSDADDEDVSTACRARVVRGTLSGSSDGVRLVWVARLNESSPAQSIGKANLVILCLLRIFVKWGPFGRLASPVRRYLYRNTQKGG